MTACSLLFRSLHIRPVPTILEKYPVQVSVNVIGMLLCTFCVVSIAILSLHSQILAPDVDFQHAAIGHFSRYGTHFKSYNLLHSCLTIYESQTWNYVSLVILLLCFISHGLVLLHMFYTNNELRRTLKLKPSIFVISAEDEEHDLKIPSTRTLPNSPIFPHNTNMILTPIMEKKAPK